MNLQRCQSRDSWSKAAVLRSPLAFTWRKKNLMGYLVKQNAVYRKEIAPRTKSLKIYTGIGKVRMKSSVWQSLKTNLISMLNLLHWKKSGKVVAQVSIMVFETPKIKVWSKRHYISSKWFERFSHVWHVFWHIELLHFIEKKSNVSKSNLWLRQHNLC